MPDVFPAKTRSYIMSRIRSRWTLQERTIHSYLKGWRIRHTMHPKVPGSPDILVRSRLAVFIHGCFWHGCPRCYVPPKSRQAYWHLKIRRNRRRDRKSLGAARRAGFCVLRIWEHEFRASPKASANKIAASVDDG